MIASGNNFLSAIPIVGSFLSAPEITTKSTSSIGFSDSHFENIFLLSYFFHSFNLANLTDDYPPFLYFLVCSPLLLDSASTPDGENIL
jgi:hypothetical protein